MPETNLAKFKKLLSELFMLDRADLDFGIYRIMNSKREEITRFLNKDLLPQVREELSRLGAGDRAQLEQDYQEALEQAKRFGVVDPENAPPVIEAARRSRSRKRAANCPYASSTVPTQKGASRSN